MEQTEKQRDMAEKFDYAKAVAELEEIAKKVENPETKLDEVDVLVGRARSWSRPARSTCAR